MEGRKGQNSLEHCEKNIFTNLTGNPWSSSSRQALYWANVKPILVGLFFQKPTPISPRLTYYRIWVRIFQNAKVGTPPHHTHARHVPLEPPCSPRTPLNAWSPMVNPLVTPPANRRFIVNLRLIRSPKHNPRLIKNRCTWSKPPIGFTILDFFLSLYKLLLITFSHTTI